MVETSTIARHANRCKRPARRRDSVPAPAMIEMVPAVAAKTLLVEFLVRVLSRLVEWAWPEFRTARW